MSSRFNSMNSWQGSLRGVPSQRDSAGLKPATKEKRNALGDISNRSQTNSFGLNGGKKSTAKPSFAIKQEDPITGRTSMGQASSATAIHFTALPEVDRVDANDVNNPKYAAEYVVEIYENFKKIETKYLPSPNYMEKQSDINEKMRALLIDWLIQVHAKFELLPQTLYLTVNVIDRFLERKIVPRRKLQLVGCASMLLASKYEEIYAPECQDFVSMSDNAFSVDDLLKMEGIILNVLGFRLTAPSPYTFLRRHMKIASSSAETQHFATYLIERSLQEYELLVFKPSMIAASALFIAQAITEKKMWTSTLVRHSGYSEEDLQECVLTLKEVYRACDLNKNYLQAVSKKYSSSKYMSVATIPLD